jgi:hypothetical protein
VVVNGKVGAAVDESRRKDFLCDVLRAGATGITTFDSHVPLAKAWNTGIQAMKQPVTVILNDDVFVDPEYVAADLDRLVEGAGQSGLALGGGVQHLYRGGPGGSASHFAISLNLIEQIGWFDEQYLGVGCEDVDYLLRYKRHLGHPPGAVYLHGMGNQRNHIMSKYATVQGKYSLFNHIYHQLKHAGHKIDETHKGVREKGSVRTTVEPYPLWNLHKNADALLMESNVNEIENRVRNLCRFETV